MLRVGLSGMLSSDALWGRIVYRDCVNLAALILCLMIIRVRCVIMTRLRLGRWCRDGGGLV